MSEAIDQPAAAGVDGPGNSAQTDDIDTEAFDRVEVPEDDEPPADATGDGTEGEGDDDPDKPKAATEDDDHVEIERDGQKYRVPKALKDDLLRHADYTQKTQDLAKERQNLAEEKTTWESQREESRAALPEEHKRVALLEHRLSETDAEMDRPLDRSGTTLRNIDWDAFRRQVDGLPADDPGRATYATLRDRFMALRDSRIDLTDKLGEAKTDLQTKEEARLSEHREKASAALRQAQQETGRVLAAEVKGWNAETAAKTIEFANDHLGITPEEMGAATDPRLWKLVHWRMTAEAEIASLKKALKQQATADSHGKAQGTTPAATTRGGGSTPRDPSTPRGDALGTETWMERRRKQLAAKGR